VKSNRTNFIRERDEKPLPIILFQNRPLPPSAIFIDVATGKLFNASEETSLWFWRFTICVSVSKKADSTTVLQHSNKLQSLLAARPESLVNQVAKLCARSDPELILKEWTRTLEIMIDEAQKANDCEWTAQ